jgi:YQGE family putative transporter
MSFVKKEYDFFCKQPKPMRLLVMTNMVYALVIPVIELFLGAYIIRKSNDVSLVIVYQLAQGTGTPVTFILNGFLLKHFPIAALYSVGMIISGLDMAVMMILPELHFGGVALIGLIMGMSYGFFWSNRVFLALTNTNNSNRNYYYGLETFLFTIASIIMPIMAGYFIASTHKLGWFGGQAIHAYQFLTVLVILLTVIASWLIHKGGFRNPKPAKFIYFRFDRLWKKMLLLAGFKGVAQGFIIAAPVMLIMRLVGEEGSIGSIQSSGAALSAVMLYWLGRKARPDHRLKIFAAGLLLFLAGAIVNTIRFDALGVIVFVGCLVFARPLLDMAYFPIQLGVIDRVAAKEKRNQFAYIFNHEIGLYLGRLGGCLLFIIVSRKVSEEAALRYALLSVAAIQALSIFAAKSIINDAKWREASEKLPLDPQALKEPVEL